MKDSSSIRRNNLRTLIDTAFEGNKSLFSRLANASSSEISGLYLGSRPFGERKARKLEMDLNLPIGFFDDLNDVSPEMKTLLLKLGDEARRRGPYSRYALKRTQPETVQIKVFDNPELQDPYFVTQRAFSNEFFKRTGRSPEYAQLFWQHDKSMDPTIGKESACLVDTSDKRVADGSIYLISTKRGYAIRRILEDYDTGGYVIRCDNRDSTTYPDRKVSTIEHVQVVGRIFWTERKL